MMAEENKKNNVLEVSVYPFLFNRKNGKYAVNETHEIILTLKKPNMIKDIPDTNDARIEIKIIELKN